VKTVLWVLLGWSALSVLLAPLVGRVLRDRRVDEVLRDQRERLARGDRSDSPDPREPPVPSGHLDRKGRREWRDRQEWLAQMERADHLAHKARLAPQDPKGHRRPR
jgi:hypothetical protein